jgi:type II secretory ATPase GspE/PulE/Tfp pilus assembly ATPase PilB-like protein
VRLICPKCKCPLKAQEEILAKIRESSKVEDKEFILYTGKGCEVCRFTGYHSRTAIYEVLTVTEAIRELILSHASSQQIKHKAIAQGMRTLRQDGLQKVLMGLTTYEEVLRVTQQEELPED